MLNRRKPSSYYIYKVIYNFKLKRKNIHKRNPTRGLGSSVILCVSVFLLCLIVSTLPDQDDLVKCLRLCLRLYVIH